jgi:hypothetical protein
MKNGKYKNSDNKICRRNNSSLQRMNGGMRSAHKPLNERI